MKVLLVDDEQKFATMLAKRLALRGIDADYVFTGEDALKKVADTAYDVAILDIKMPGIGGIKLKNKLNEIVPDLKVVFLTGHGSQADFKSGAANGILYLAKPLQLERLIALLNDLCQ